MTVCTATPISASSPCRPAAVIPDAGIANFASGGDDYLDGGNGNDTIVGDALNFSSFSATSTPASRAA